MDSFWKSPRRIIQTNLQVKDTAKIDPERLAQQMEELQAEVLVFNVGGIYAWYQSSIPYHHINEYLDPSRDLLQEVVSCCHKRGIRVVGRFDFSRAEDKAYQAHPEWFAQTASGDPMIVGSTRPGEWSLLYTVCMSSGYWKEEMAAPVLREALNRYPLDGVFFNGVTPPDCRCDICRERYFRLFGEQMPAEKEKLAPSWVSRQIEENIDYLRNEIRKVSPEIPVIVYHWPAQSRDLTRPMEDLICDESQNVLSRGRKHLSPDWTPSYKMKLCATDSTLGPPCGIIHSSPGMDWRHVGLPPAEYQFWMSQVFAAGGSLWHSLTGIPDTIEDRRILQEVKKANRNARAGAEIRKNMIAAEDMALLFDPLSPPHGWLSILYGLQIQFSLVSVYRPVDWTLHRTLVIPEGLPLSPETGKQLIRFVREGGRLLLEGKLPESLPELAELCGIAPFQKLSEYYSASYLELSGDWEQPEKSGLPANAWIPFRGRVALSRKSSGRVLATLVPPFAPLDAVGAPPERASILSRHTEIPLCIENHPGKGHVILLTFSLSRLVEEFSLSDHYQLAQALLSRILPHRTIQVSCGSGLIVHVSCSTEGMLIDFVNCEGKRPLRACVPISTNASVYLPENRHVYWACDLISEQMAEVCQKGRNACFSLDIPDAMRTVFLSFLPCREKGNILSDLTSDEKGGEKNGTV